MLDLQIGGSPVLPEGRKQGFLTSFREKYVWCMLDLQIGGSLVLPEGRKQGLRTTSPRGKTPSRRVRKLPTTIF